MTARARCPNAIDAAGHTVAPGFNDLLSSIRPERKAHEDKAADGEVVIDGGEAVLDAAPGRWLGQPKGSR